VLLLQIGHVAVVYENGHLQVIPPATDGMPGIAKQRFQLVKCCLTLCLLVIVDSENTLFGEMFNCQKQTLRFPSEKTKQERENEVRNAEDKKAINCKGGVV
jgi:hypothetical protein